MNYTTAKFPVTYEHNFIWYHYVNFNSRFDLLCVSPDVPLVDLAITSTKVKFLAKAPRVKHIN